MFFFLLLFFKEVKPADTHKCLLVTRKNKQRMLEGKGLEASCSRDFGLFQGQKRQKRCERCDATGEQSGADNLCRYKLLEAHAQERRKHLRWVLRRFGLFYVIL